MNAEAERFAENVREWIDLMCQDCGHWIVMKATKEEIADWLRAHPRGALRIPKTHIARASTCPSPCRLSLADLTYLPTEER